jgi:hypothetical protein
MVADLSKRCSCFGVGSEEVCQVSSVKLITEFPPRGTPNSVLYDMANLRSLNMRRNDSFLIFIYKIIHGIINSPFLLSQIYFNMPRANLRSGRFFMFRGCFVYGPVFYHCIIRTTLMKVFRVLEFILQLLVADFQC